MNSLIKINGRWDEGYVLEQHMISSEFIGYDKNGREKYKNKRSELGELIYQFKYRNRIEKLPIIIEIIKHRIRNIRFTENIDVIIPVPASNFDRKYQPVYLIAKALARYMNKDYKEDILEKIDKKQSKDGEFQMGCIIKKKNFSKLSNILIVDDLYSTGNTLNEVVKLLRTDANINKIYCLVLTKTKRGVNN